jgi:hypothetical protein
MVEIQDKIVSFSQRIDPQCQNRECIDGSRSVRLEKKAYLV